MKLQILVAPCKLIPAHTITFIGCLGRGLFLGFSPFFLEHILRCVSISVYLLRCVAVYLRLSPSPHCESFLTSLTAFVSCWMELCPVHQDDLVTSLTQALSMRDNPDHPKPCRVHRGGDGTCTPWTLLVNH